ncbi:MULTISPECIES: hypothetical protein [Ensifer]|uniref:hypothetical protein n=1 Tax=Ensifer TaxID=106591 RepID=UPI0011474DB6|nr:hypothetical protein [Ensifer adhaerens]
MLKNEGPGYVPHLIVAGLAVLLIWEIHWFIRSLRFYKGNGWDFTVDFGPKMYWGESTDPDFEMSPRENHQIAHLTCCDGDVAWI